MSGLSAPGASFAALGLLPPLLRAAAACGLAEPTPVQAATLPPALQRQDVLGCAPTGSGKTAAFGLALLQPLAPAPGPRAGVSARQGRRRTAALVLVPTRELALQVGQTLRALAGALPAVPHVAVVHGGVSPNPQMLALRGGAEVVVATPGRLLDLVQRNALQLGDEAVLVLDEADRLLEDGFAEELARIQALLPARRQIEKRQGLRVPREQVPGYEPADTALPPPLPPPSAGGVKGRRKSRKDKLREAAAAGPSGPPTASE